VRRKRRRRRRRRRTTNYITVLIVSNYNISFIYTFHTYK
jgi:hypothetical protein